MPSRGTITRMSRPPKQPPYRISVRPATVSPEEREIRLRKTFDILVDEALRQRDERRKRARRRHAR